MYDPTNWYWAVAGSTTQVWASARAAYVPVADTAYAAWLAAGNLPTKIDTAANLLAVLQQQWVPMASAGGIAITSTGTPALNATYGIDPASVSNIQAVANGIANGKGLPGGGATFLHPDIAGTGHAFSSVNFLNFAAALRDYIYAFNQALGARVAGGVPSMPTQPVSIA